MTDTPSRNHNFLKSLAGDIRDGLERAKGASKETLEAFRSIGEALNCAKNELANEKGAFGRWCEEEGFPFDKTWRARLMKLDTYWDEIQRAIAETPNVGTKAYSVDGALAIWKAWKEANDPELAAKKAEREAKKAEREREKAERAAKEKADTDEVAALKEALAAALKRIKELEDKLAAKENKSSSSGKASDATGNGATSEVKVDAATRARARKVWGLYTKGATDGEKEAAKARLDAMAAKFNVSFEEFCAACGLAA